MASAATAQPRSPQPPDLGHILDGAMQAPPSPQTASQRERYLGLMQKALRLGAERYYKEAEIPERATQEQIKAIRDAEPARAAKWCGIAEQFAACCIDSANKDKNFPPHLAAAILRRGVKNNEHDVWAVGRFARFFICSMVGIASNSPENLPRRTRLINALWEYTGTPQHVPEFYKNIFAIDTDNFRITDPFHSFSKLVVLAPEPGEFIDRAEPGTIERNKALSAFADVTLKTDMVCGYWDLTSHAYLGKSGLDGYHSIVEAFGTDFKTGEPVKLPKRIKSGSGLGKLREPSNLEQKINEIISSTAWKDLINQAIPFGKGAKPRNPDIVGPFANTIRDRRIIAEALQEEIDTLLDEREELLSDYWAGAPAETVLNIGTEGKGSFTKWFRDQFDDLPAHVQRSYVNLTVFQSSLDETEFTLNLIGLLSYRANHTTVNALDTFKGLRADFEHYTNWYKEESTRVAEFNGKIPMTAVPPYRLIGEEALPYIMGQVSERDGVTLAKAARIFTAALPLRDHRKLINGREYDRYKDSLVDALKYFESYFLSGGHWLPDAKGESIPLERLRNFLPGKVLSRDEWHCVRMMLSIAPLGLGREQFINSVSTTGFRNYLVGTVTASRKVQDLNYVIAKRIAERASPGQQLDEKKIRATSAATVQSLGLEGVSKELDLLATDIARKSGDKDKEVIFKGDDYAVPVEIFNAENEISLAEVLDRARAAFPEGRNLKRGELRTRWLENKEQIERAAAVGLSLRYGTTKDDQTLINELYKFALGQAKTEVAVRINSQKAVVERGLDVGTDTTPRLRLTVKLTLEQIRALESDIEHRGKEILADLQAHSQAGYIAPSSIGETWTRLAKLRNSYTRFHTYGTPLHYVGLVQINDGEAARLTIEPFEAPFERLKEKVTVCHNVQIERFKAIGFGAAFATFEARVRKLEERFGKTEQAEKGKPPKASTKDKSWFVALRKLARHGTMWNAADAEYFVKPAGKPLIQLAPATTQVHHLLNTTLRNDESKPNKALESQLIFEGSEGLVMGLSATFQNR